MKKVLTTALAGVAFAATVSFVIVGGSNRAQATEPDTLPGYEIIAAVRAVGFDAISEPIRGGSYYMLHAHDPYGIEVRVMVDAQFGGVLSVSPVHAIDSADAPRYDRGPRIIHVPQTDDDRGSVNKRDESATINDSKTEEPVLLPKSRRAAPKP